MSIAYAVLQGLIQGVSEFFPISSSGHLVMFQQIFKILDPSDVFYIFLHAGSLIAVTAYFARDIVRLFTDDRKMLALLVAGTIPTIAIGYYFPHVFTGYFMRYRVMAAAMAANGFALIVASYVNKNADRCDGRKEPGMVKAFAVGIVQGLGVIPGTSRTAMTIMGSIFAGFDRESVFRFSFLLSIPVVAGEVILKCVRTGPALLHGDTVGFLLGGLVAMVVSFGSLMVMRKVLISNKLYPFGVYCAVLGIAMSVFMFKLR